MSVQKVLVGLDFSSFSDSVFREALDIARQNQAELFLFHCISVDTLMTPPPFSGELGLSPHLVDQAYQVQSMQLQEHTKLAIAQFHRYQAEAELHHLHVEYDYQVTDAGSGLCRKAEEWEADLIVIGRRGRQGLTEMLLGSVSNYVVHHAPCMVLVVQGKACQTTQTSAASLDAIEYAT
ncbi:MAG: universal stress protein [Leptolyngbyaceae bacterium]|nr:universal stress protein [Leptolyngbyaceae bacterium]